MATKESTQERVQAFGMALRLARVRAGLHQGAVAKQIGVHATAISQMERGDRTDLPDERTITKLDDFMGANGELAAAAGLKLPTDRRRKTAKIIEIDVTDLTTAQVREIQHAVDMLVKGYRSK